MNWAVWDDVETPLREHHIKPIVAVVPDNRDPSLNRSAPAWRSSGRGTWLPTSGSRRAIPSTRRRGVLTQLGLRRISDGFFSTPRPIVVAPYGSQQLWRLKRRGRGLWTVCYHINRWTDADVAGSVAT